MSTAATPSLALAQLVATTAFDRLPAATVQAARRALLDAVGVSLAAVKLGEGCGAFADLARAQGGAAESTLLGTEGTAQPRQVTAAMAAFANGALAHAVDFEDSHDAALVHPNAAAVPAALAVAEQTGADGERLLTALVVGCEVVCRLGLALRVPLDDFGWYPPPILGAFGATAAAASLYGLPAEQVRDAFSLTLCQATCSAEIKHSPRSLIRGIRDAFAAKAGVISAQLAGRGITGFEQPFEGEAGFFAAFARGRFDPEALVRAAGDAFEIERLSFKPWPSCRGTHVYIEAALMLRRDHDVAAEDVTRVRLTGSRLNRMLAEPADSKRRPATAIDARFSLPYTVATALRHGDVRLEHFHPQALGDPAVHQLAELVEFQADESAESDTGSMTRGTLTLHTRDGRNLHQRMDSPLGHPTRPLSDAALEDKFRRCAAAGGLAPEQVERLITAVGALENTAEAGKALMALTQIH